MGSGESKRELYTTDSEYAFKVRRPVIVNGINIPSDRADLLSRFVALEVPPISAEERVTESKFWEDFEAERGKLLGAFFDILSGTLRNRKPLGWAPRLSDWGVLASSMYEHLGWGRDMFKLDYQVVEGKQHDDALEGLVGEHVLEYLYAEFDDGKDVLAKTTHDIYEDVKARVPFDSRRWFPVSSRTFGKELQRLKQALAYKGFAIDKGTVGRGNDKRYVIKITRLDEVGSSGVIMGSSDSETDYPTESRVDKPESARSGRVGSLGSSDSLPLSGRKKKKVRRSRKKAERNDYPNYPTGQKSPESGLDKPNGAGSSDKDSDYPTTTPTDPETTPASPNGLIRTDEGVQDAIRKLKGDK
jgi:hypothetical protein